MKYLILFVVLAAFEVKAETREEKVITLTLLAEARGEKFDGMAAVCAVIKQRSINRNISPEKVCLQRKQFSCWNGKTINDLNYLLTKTPKKIVDQAKYLAQNINNINLSKINNADHYYSTIIAPPYWAKGKKPVAKIGKHVFFKLN